jgi:hypothetical protein
VHLLRVPTCADFLLGLQAGDMPRNPADIKDIEICRFLVGPDQDEKEMRNPGNKAIWRQDQAALSVP